MKSLVKRENLSEKKGSNKSGVTGSLYVTAGEKCKAIGWQDGLFRDFGHHLEDEMGGIWVHPIKIADAFWLNIDGQFYKADEYETLPYGNIFRYNLPCGVNIKRFQFSPDEVKGLAIKYIFENATKEKKRLELKFITRFDLLPVWFSKENGILDFEDSACFDEANQVIVAKDQGHDWYGLMGCNFNIDAGCVTITKEHIGHCETVGKGVSAGINKTIELAPHGEQTITFYLVGSYIDKNDALEDFHRLKKDEKALLENKIRRYQAIKSRTDLKTDEEDFDQVFEWIKYNTDWLVADCGKYGRGLTAGIPEYPWWFGCDNSYSIQGLLALGEFELAKQTIMLLKNYSEKINGNGRIVHEITTNGMIPNPGNSQETGHFITAVYNYWRWTGDVDLVKDVYDYCVKGIDWLLNEMDEDRDLLPSGYGIIEIEGMNVELIDTAVYTCQALFCIYEMSKALGKENKYYLETAHKLKKIINTRLWDEKEGLFVDAVGTPRQILERIDILLKRSKESHNITITEEYKAYLDNLKEQLSTLPADEELPFIINKNWVINIPMETRIADTDKALIALKTMRSEDFVGKYGVYLSGFMHKHIMTISTGVQAVAEGRYKCVNHSLELLKRMCSTFSMVLPGSISEMSPDYGCFTQAWTVYAMMVPVVECFAGICPAAHNNKLTIEPCVPDAWSKMSLTNVRVGSARIDFTFSRQKDREIYSVTSTGTLDIDFIPAGSYREIKVNGLAHEGHIRFGAGTTVIELVK